MPADLQKEYGTGRKVGKALQKTLYYAALQAHRGITPQDVAALLAPLARVDTLGADAAEDTINKLGHTLTEAQARENLGTALKETMGAASQKYRYTDKVHLRLYRIKLKCGREDLLTYANNMIVQAGKDGLPATTLEKLLAAAQARQSFMDADDTQLEVIGKGKMDHGLLRQLKQQIHAARGVIQYAADTEWPRQDPANAGVREEFLLPAKSRFKGY